MNYKEIEKVYLDIESIAKNYKLDIHENNIFMISSETMVEMYISGGLPIYFSHWSFGKRFSEDFELYKNNQMGLAYEIIAATNPCTTYLMENNTDLVQKLVIAHACFGHNHFFKNNYLYSSVNILPYAEYARDFINECRMRYGEVEVDSILDACLILQWFGVDENSNYNFGDLLKTINIPEFKDSWEMDRFFSKQELKEKPERNIIKDFQNNENLLDIISKYSELDEWKKEIVKIISVFSKFFWKNILTKTINEGFATFIHYKIMNEMDLTQGEMLQFLGLHTGVANAPKYSSANKINPYYLGFYIFQDIEKRFGMDYLLNVVKNYRDDNFLEQFLTREIMESKLKLMYAEKKMQNAESVIFQVKEIQDEDGYRFLKDKLINSLSYNTWKPRIVVDNINLISHSIKILTSKNDDIANFNVLKKSLKTLWGEGDVYVTPV
jgi:spore cortex formation protein SpoVR/YcgB (stage V sporulation)